MANKFIVGAYACAPVAHNMDRAEEEDFWEKLAQMPLVGGIEHPCIDQLHAYGDEFLLERIPAHWEVVITGIPGTMGRRVQNPAFGLASHDAASRAQAVAYAKHIFEKIQKINDKLGRKAVKALEIYSAPSVDEKGQPSDPRFFLDGLQEILQWKWDCALLIEHCDARGSAAPAKSFLPLEDELHALKNVATNGNEIGMCINWARSVLENKSVDRPVEHIGQSAQVGMLKALMFSGCAAEGAYGPWKDVHAPFAPFEGAKFGCAQSLMTLDEAKRCYAAAKGSELLFSGIKLLEIDQKAGVEQRIGIIEDGLKAVQIASQSAL